MKTARILSLTLALFIGALAISARVAPTSTPKEGAIRVLFLGHESEHHNSNKFYPMLAKALGRDAIYFDYVTNVEEALGDAEYLSKFDAVLLYANHGKITPSSGRTSKATSRAAAASCRCIARAGASATSQVSIKLVGGRFDSHKTGTFTAKVVDAKHPAMAGVQEFEAWDETYKHKNHNEKDRTVLMVREIAGRMTTSPNPSRGPGCAPKGRGAFSTPPRARRAGVEAAGFPPVAQGGDLMVGGRCEKAVV